ncbi:Sec-independent protein translocase subunit TatA [Nocardia yamanashiensis]|uniref:Sec-independent protein translocase subunit TatA n=1 Tax=Nocardia yamanashiensis TaxID=209247 RepID=UPI001E58CE40|nr:Sec-independent protein translocase subunit TatA [Nocardia yamanashiensis]UGT44329.1 Sec-independent protein translocase subunit TatA [Nocardia yamanashiensis]
MGSLSPTHLLIVALVFLLFFGAKRMPDAARGLGRSLRIFKSEMNQMQTEGKAEEAAPAAAPQPQAQLPQAQTAAPAANLTKPQGDQQQA